MFVIRQRMDKKDSICSHAYLMQTMPNNTYLKWVGHGHDQRKLWAFIVSFSLSVVNEEWWRGCLTTSLPQCIGLYLNKIHVTCPRKWCRNHLTLHIGIPQSVAPSLGCSMRISLRMSYRCFPWTRWSCKRLHTTSPQVYQQDYTGGRRHHGPLFLCRLVITRSIPWRM